MVLRKNQPTKIEGIDYSPEGIRELRKEIIGLRDGALDQGEMTWSIVLSHNIALLSYLADLIAIEEEHA